MADALGPVQGFEVYVDRKGRVLLTFLEQEWSVERGHHVAEPYIFKLNKEQAHKLHEELGVALGTEKSHTGPSAPVRTDAEGRQKKVIGRKADIILIDEVGGGARDEEGEPIVEED